MNRPYNTTRRIIETDYRRERRMEKPQEKTEAKIHSTNNKGSRIRLVICPNKKENGQ